MVIFWYMLGSSPAESAADPVLEVSVLADPDECCVPPIYHLPVWVWSAEQHADRCVQSVFQSFLFLCVRKKECAICPWLELLDVVVSARVFTKCTLSAERFSRDLSATFVYDVWVCRSERRGPGVQ